MVSPSFGRLSDSKKTVLKALKFGERIAEQEIGQLATYFVETDQWDRVFSGAVDVIYGPKGSGKSAIYTTLVQRSPELLKRKIVMVSAEEVRGAPAFEGLVTDPPSSEAEFRNFWKLYFLALTAKALKDHKILGSEAERVVREISKAGLVPANARLAALIQKVLDYIRSKVPGVKGVQGEVKLDPVTGTATSIGGSITFDEPTEAKRLLGDIPIDELFRMANEALEKSGVKLWIAIDRLDVAFAENPKLEQNALRALFKAYIDFLAYEQVRLKIFLRTDIWKKITESGFREASHITRTVTIAWDPQSLMNLIVRRALRSEGLAGFYKVDGQQVLGAYEKQVDLFYKIFPDKVEAGSKKPETFVWIISRTQDGTRQVAPREVIHLLTTSQEEQLRKIEIGQVETQGDNLISRLALKEAMEQVSKVRLEQTLLAEHPQLRDRILALKGKKTEQTAQSLAKIWKLKEGEALRVAKELSSVGFFEERMEEHPSYWVPFIYRSALGMVQGTADE